MDEFAIENEVPNLHEIQTIDVAVNGMKEGVFTWGGLTAGPEKDNRSSDAALSRKKSADVIVPAKYVQRKILGKDGTAVRFFGLERSDRNEQTR